MSNLRTWVAWPIIAALILLSPVAAFLMVISAELLIDLVTEAGTPAVCAVAAGVVAWVLFRKLWPHADMAPQLEPGLVTDDTVIAAPPL